MALRVLALAFFFVPLAHANHDCKKRSSHLWECVDYYDAPRDGIIYIYRLRPEFDDLTSGDPSRKQAARDRNALIEPALEMGSEIVNTFALWNDHKKWVEKTFEFFTVQRWVHDGINVETQALVQDLPPMGKIVKLLGYRCDATPDGIFLHLPDKAAFLSAWTLARARYPFLPRNLSIWEMDFIADDVTYTRGYLLYDLQWSAFGEFPHDHQFHALRLIELIVRMSLWTSDPYEVERERYREPIRTLLEHILTQRPIANTEAQRNIVASMLHELAYFTDGFATISTYGYLKFGLTTSYDFMKRRVAILEGNLAQDRDETCLTRSDRT